MVAAGSAYAPASHARRQDAYASVSGDLPPGEAPLDGAASPLADTAGLTATDNGVGVGGGGDEDDGGDGDGGAATERAAFVPPPGGGRLGTRWRPARVVNWWKLAAAVGVLVGACVGLMALLDASTPPVGTAAARAVADAVLASMDRSASPCNDMYAYACGGWERRTPIPGSRSGTSRGFTAAADRIREQLRGLLEMDDAGGKGTASRRVWAAVRRGGGGSSGSGDGDGDAAATAAMVKPRAFYAACMAARGDERRRRWGLFGYRHGPGAAAAVDLGAPDSPLARFAAPAAAMEAAPAGADAPTAASVAAAAAYFHAHCGGSPFLGLTVDVDARHPSTYGLYVSQGGLGLPHRDYYLADDETHTPVRAAYVVLLTKLAAAASSAGLLGGGAGKWGAFDDAAAVAAAVLEVETRLATLTAPPEDLRDPDQWYNVVAVDKLPVVSALLDAAGVKPPLWTGQRASAAAAGLRSAAATARQGGDPASEPEATPLVTPAAAALGGNDTGRSVIVDVPAFFDGLSALFSEAVAPANATALSALRAYVVLRATRHVAGSGAAGAPLYGALYEMAKVSRGLRAVPPSWEACLGSTNVALGEALSAAYVATYFPEAARSAATATVGDVRTAFGRMLAAADWMDADTKSAAQAKLEGIRLKVGYKDDLDTYDELSIVAPGQFDVPHPHAANLLAAYEHEWRKSIARLDGGALVDTKQWSMLPTEVNAYYDPTRNEVVAPAGILQSPFWSTQFPAALNYGGIGAVLGHEISHAFDDSGRKFDATGALRDWWTPSAAASFRNRTGCLVSQYSAYSPPRSPMHVNGNLTLGENLADAGGIRAAYAAYRAGANATAASASAPRNEVLSAAMSDEQLFFLAYAQTWCTKRTTASTATLLATDPHSPGRFRVQGVLSGYAPFVAAFNCPASSRYASKPSCPLW